jgi:hypothetical protein
LNSGPILGLTPGQNQPNTPSVPGGPLGGGFGGGFQQQAKTATATPTADDSDKASGSDKASDEEGNASASGSASGSNSSSGSSSSPSSGFNGPTFGGGPILGVASLSKAKSVRVFFNKSQYKDWFFIYVPTADTGGLLVGPVNPNAPTGNVNGMAPGSGMGGAPVAGQAVMQGPSPGQSQNPTPPTQNPGQTPPEQ